MAIKDLEARQSNVDIVVEVTFISEPRAFEKFGKEGRVATATVKDETGEMKMTLWNEQIDKVKPGDKVHIKNGFVSEWQGEKQLTTGRLGTMEVAETTKTLTEEEPKEAEEEKPEETEAAEEEKPEEETTEAETAEEDIDVKEEKVE